LTRVPSTKSTNASWTRIRLEVLAEQVVGCTRCPELRKYCSDIGRQKRKAFHDWKYWARPVPWFGDPAARIAIVGLAPAAHGANRTGRMFTGDRSGDFLYAALHRAGLANQSHSHSPDDGLRLTNVFITAPVRCAPPANKPTPAQIANCSTYIRAELELVKPRVVLCLGAIAWRAMLDLLRSAGQRIPQPLPRFSHGGELTIGATTLLGCYHVSQQNTFTGRLTAAMIDEVIARAMQLAGTEQATRVAG
jgi:uracil-DNA glycosylase family 4